MTFSVRRVNNAPLFGGLERFDLEKSIRSFKASWLIRLRQELTQETFSPRAKAALSKAMKIKVGPNSLTLTAKHPAWRPLVEGQRKGAMKWLAKARAPIPIVLDTGKVIFRVATPKSLASGKWVHPGREPSHFVDRALKKTKKAWKLRVAKEAVRAMGGNHDR